MKSMKASEFKAKCLQLMDQVAESGEGVVVTKNGKPVSRLEPFKARPSSLFGVLSGAIEISDDIISPVGAEWEVES